MKIGILTFHCAHNYGAVLQAYASKVYLESMGHEIYFVDYRPRFLTHKYKVYNLNRYFSFSPIKTIKKLSYELAILNERRKKYQNFEKFINYKLLKNGERACSVVESFNKLDCIYLGSDQIWNVSLVGDSLSLFLGNLGFNIPVFSYGASIENDVPANCKSIFEKSFNRMTAISVREVESQKMLALDFKINSEVVVDPTLLLTKEQWGNFSAPVDYNKKYVLFYYFGNDNVVLDSAERFAKKHGCELLVISVGVYKDKRYLNSISPENFVWLISHASFVLTNSFHGTVFSIIFNRPFYTLTKKGSNIRIYNLCDLAGYKARIIDSIDDNLLWDELPLPDSRLNERIRKSRNFINKALNNVSKQNESIK